MSGGPRGWARASGGSDGGSRALWTDEGPEMAADERDDRIAIIGMAGRFPGAADLRELWRNLAGGVESITFFSPEELLAAGVDRHRLARPEYVRAQGRLADIDLFDAAFFG